MKKTKEIIYKEHVDCGTLENIPLSNAKLSNAKCKIVKKDVVRIQRKRTKGWRMPPNSKYIGRGSKWGNPFRVVKLPDGKWSVKTSYGEMCIKILVSICRPVYETKQEAARDAVKCYEKWIIPYSHKDGGMGEFLYSAMTLGELVDDLSGYEHLACWCKLGEPCHVDFIISLLEKLNF